MRDRASGTVDALWREAQALARSAAARHPARAGRPPLPPLLFFTDPERTPDPLAIAARLPRGAGVVYRHFGAADRAEVASALARIARRRGLRLLIGADPALAAEVGAAGVHLPERRIAEARRLRARRPDWLLTGAAHGAVALGRAAALGLDAAVLSPVLASASPSAGAALEPIRTAALVRAARLPVYGLGGVDARTARRLRFARLCGLAAVSGLGSEG